MKLPSGCHMWRCDQHAESSIRHWSLERGTCITSLGTEMMLFSTKPWKIINIHFKIPSLNGENSPVFLTFNWLNPAKSQGIHHQTHILLRSIQPFTLRFGTPPTVPTGGPCWSLWAPAPRAPRVDVGRVQHEVGPWLVDKPQEYYIRHFINQWI